MTIALRGRCCACDAIQSSFTRPGVVDREDQLDALGYTAFAAQEIKGKTIKARTNAPEMLKQTSGFRPEIAICLGQQLLNSLTSNATSRPYNKTE